MRVGKFLLVLTVSFIMFFSAMVTETLASDGVPAAMLTTNDSGMTLMGFNISSDIPRDDIDGLYSLASGLLGKLGAQGAILSYGPSDLEGLGFTGDSLHLFARSNITTFYRYLQITVSSITTPVPGYRIEVFMWDNTENTNGTDMAAIEIPEELPLLQLLGILESGTHNLKIHTTANETTKIARMDFYYQSAPGAEELYLASVEITDLLMKMALMSLMQ
ncbi:MAG: hypothetical protein HQK67_05985 [Desulfamplus sp.]|nr:hypothetical protein [Desulfamplus sp.]